MESKINGLVIFADPAGRRNFNRSAISFTFHVLLEIGQCQINIADISRFRESVKGVFDVVPLSVQIKSRTGYCSNASQSACAVSTTFIRGRSTK
jgi:hypothetical protein